MDGMLRPALTHPCAMVRPALPQPSATAHQPQLSNRMAWVHANSLFIFDGLNPIAELLRLLRPSFTSSGCSSVHRLQAFFHFDWLSVRYSQLTSHNSLLTYSFWFFTFLSLSHCLTLSFSPGPAPHVTPRWGWDRFFYFTVTKLTPRWG